MTTLADRSRPRHCTLTAGAASADTFRVAVLVTRFADPRVAISVNVSIGSHKRVSSHALRLVGPSRSAGRIHQKALNLRAASLAEPRQDRIADANDVGPPSAGPNEHLLARSLHGVTRCLHRAD